MTNPKTCKNCVHWGKGEHKQIEGRNHLGNTYFRHGVQFAGSCQCVNSPKWNWSVCESDTCDKHESNDKQRELELRDATDGKQAHGRAAKNRRKA